MNEEQPLENRVTIRLEVLPGNTVPEKVALAAECGFDGIAFPGRFRDRFGDETISVVNDLPIPVQTVSLGFEGSLCSPDSMLRQRCRESLEELFDFAQAIGARSINMPPVLIEDNPERYPTDAIQQQDDLLISQLPELGDRAGERGLDLLIEPVNRKETDYLHSVVHAAKVCEQVNHPRIGLTPDFFHMQFEEDDMAEALREAMPWVRHIHTAEHNRVEPGPGELDFRPGFAVLKQAGYAGLIEVECRNLSGPAEKVLPLSAKYLRREWAES